MATDNFRQASLAAQHPAAMRLIQIWQSLPSQRNPRHRSVAKRRSLVDGINMAVPA
ncbi:hypothetical protein [Roseisalinus antarcticus]|uniref:hypothetical protein n=1 Tax=Roseisalinus antarcticus TaxID=254357 RepID=UPI00135650C6|nr:hypothetical protein [Roseisalinus antarcticus]